MSKDSMKEECKNDVANYEKRKKGESLIFVIEKL